eukprot:TRINITY_DN1629_c0_g1_i2.p1 TRINITY_DN1629_c0_g1~~TRINITY_DN1629_c0_g1_i2.p1  ORF type:complete len:528 (-),score=123.95 TRINITY_DN1629_c0_g1_i2:527-2110(-)
MAAPGAAEAIGETGEVKLTFPAGFQWGSATAAYQIEGAAKDGGRTPSIWDTFSETPGRTVNGETGLVACDHYHRYEEDIEMMKNLGFKYYRMSVSWSRLLPAGRGAVNPDGVAFYNSLIDKLLGAGITPLVTIYHWDLPQCLDDEYGGWLGRKVVEDFEEYSASLFKLFGDRVKNWITLNEPWCSSALGYSSGEHAPGRKENPGTEAYLAAHHMVLAHAQTVQRYRKEFQKEQQGQIGITVNMDWKEPWSSSPKDVAAAQRALDWQMGLFVDPIYEGDYPESMRSFCGGRLPTFTEEEKAMVKGTNDFFGLNHYSTDYVKEQEDGEVMISMWGVKNDGGYFQDQRVANRCDDSWEKTDMGWDVVPWGLKEVLVYIQKKYQPKGGIVVTENGCAVKEDTEADALADTFRVNYFRMYIAQVHEAIQEGADVRGYFAWSLMDNFEWALGYSKRFGIIRVDYETQKRTPKDSARLISACARDNALTISAEKLRASRKPSSGPRQLPCLLSGSVASGKPVEAPVASAGAATC